MKSSAFVNRLTRAGKGRDRWPRNIGDMFYCNYLDAEAAIFARQLAGSRRFTRGEKIPAK